MEWIRLLSYNCRVSVWESKNKLLPRSLAHYSLLLGLLTDSKRHFKHGKDSLSLSDSSGRRGHMRNRVAGRSSCCCQEFWRGSRDCDPTRAGIPHPELGLFPPGWHGAHGSTAPSVKHPSDNAGLAATTASQPNSARARGWKSLSPVFC